MERDTDSVKSGSSEGSGWSPSYWEFQCFIDYNDKEDEKSSISTESDSEKGDEDGLCEELVEISDVASFPSLTNFGCSADTACEIAKNSKLEKQNGVDHRILSANGNSLALFPSEAVRPRNETESANSMPLNTM